MIKQLPPSPTIESFKNIHEIMNKPVNFAHLMAFARALEAQADLKGNETAKKTIERIKWFEDMLRMVITV